MLEKLIEINHELGLINTRDDIEFLFPNYLIRENFQLKDQINKALEWAYDNDDFDDFFSEHIDSLYDSDILTLIAECSISVEISAQIFRLYQFRSMNRYYYFVEAFGDAAHWEEHIFSVDANIHDLKSIISDFEHDCYQIHSCYGEFSKEELEDAGASFDFNIW